MKTTILILAIVTACAVTVSADPITVLNPSFETPFTTSVTVPADWTAVGANSYDPYTFNGGNVWYAGANPSTEPAPAGTGSGIPGTTGDMLGYVYGGAVGDGFTQTLSAYLLPGISYTLTVAEGRRNGTEYSSAPVTLGSEIELLAGNTVIASAIDNTGPAGGGFVDQVAFLADSDTFAGLIGDQLSIRLLTTEPYTIANQATDWDNVRLVDSASSSAVPEPATLLLLVSGLAGVVARRRNSRFSRGSIGGFK